MAVISFEPGSHALVDGGSEGRRRYLDWGMFHVEHAFLPQWRRYTRALKPVSYTHLDVYKRQVQSARTRHRHSR